MSLADELRSAFLTSGLTDDQRAELCEASEELEFADGELLFEEGEAAESLWMLLEGELELVRQDGTETVVMATMTTPGQWAGGLTAWGEESELAGYRATGRAKGTGRVLRLPSADLGRLIQAWFPFGWHMTVGIYQTIRRIEAIARQRESLVALGTLAAGLAHEINNPAAASLRAVASLRTTCDTLLESLTDLASVPITGEQFLALDELRLEARDAEPPQGTALELADREEAIGGWLASRGVAEAWEVAPGLAATGVPEDWCARVEGAVGRETLGDALAWVTASLAARSLLDELEDTTTRISALVGAVRSYSQVDRASLQRIDVHDGLESTLVMLAHELEGVDVVRSYGDDVPELDAYAGELNQVWTNLIDNAVDAMDGQGTLTVATRVEGPDLWVDISDTGVGMSATTLERAFEPFFTTKDVGRGTGLGLDISRRIVVDRHGGEITFDTSATGTTAHVRLPVQRAGG